MKRWLFVFFILFCFGLLTGCASLSQKSQAQNIKTVTSQFMVRDMTCVYAYQTDRFSNWYSIEEMGIKAANKAANDGYSDITVLITFNAPGTFWITPIMDISYWK
jgi:hypothetical protein